MAASRAALMALDLTRHVRTEESARKFLERQCWPSGQPVCPRCGGGRAYALAEGRVRCAGCRYTFHALSGRFAGLAGLTPRQWLRLLALFAVDATAHAMAAALGLAYNTAYKAATVVRLSILAASLDGVAILKSPLGAQLGSAARVLRPNAPEEPLAAVPVFGILERGDLVFVDYLPSLTPQDLLHFNRNFSLPLSRLGAIVYSDRYLRYDALVACGSDLLTRHLVEISGRAPAVDPRQTGFWPYARERLVRFHGVTAHKFPLYLKELEFRYNHRDDDILAILLANISSLVPDLN